ncbi:Transposase family Tnp2 protein [Rhizoctonia solani]|uniref:Transposase family Tnp2 protein n=1 Tax=Rhizoctonia solani TaxID=456999 RepID=A0A8H8P8Z5_9AGAM|nr:Transposase family Tnp2 protein [Rhizoctonia solani]QRW26805.1 Transposase family Tnp2 protein [Rhizoctonia solani]
MFKPGPPPQAQQHKISVGQPEAVEDLDEILDILSEVNHNTVSTVAKNHGLEIMEFDDDTQDQIPDPPAIQQNPPVTVEDWPEPPFDGSDDQESDIDDVPADSPDQDPPFVESDGPPAYHPDNKMEFSNEELQQLLELHLGSMSKAEWFELCTSKPNTLMIY